MSIPLFVDPTTPLIPDGLIVPQASPDLIVATARLLHEYGGDLTSDQIAERLDRAPRTARYALAAASAVGAARVRIMPSPRRLVASTAFSQRNAFSVSNQTVTGMRSYPFVSAFSAFGAGTVERRLREYGLHGQTVSRRVRAIGSISEYVGDYTPEYIDLMPIEDVVTPARFNAPAKRGRWADTGRPSARLVGEGFEIPVVSASARRSSRVSMSTIVDPTLTGASLAALTSNVCPDCYMARAASGACNC